MKKAILTLVWLMITIAIATEMSNHRTLKATYGMDVINNKTQGLFKRKILASNTKTSSEDLENSQYVDVNWDKDLFKLRFRGRKGGRFRIRRAPKSTLGEPWPLPQQYTVNRNIVFSLDNENFVIAKTLKTCDILEKAIQRYKDIIFAFALEEIHENFDNLLPKTNSESTSHVYQDTRSINTLRIAVKNSCAKYPSDISKEGYVLRVNESGIHLDAVEVWGALRGLETLSQLVYKRGEKFYIRQVSIDDFPRFRYRGLLVDTARHYWPKELLYSMMEAMAMTKMNAIHWHIVDDQSFPYQSKAFPELSENGAFHPSMVYTPKDIADIIEFARIRGIRVIPEFDIPGHTFSWGLGKPELMAQCYSDTMEPIPGHYINLDPSRNKTYDFLETLFKEVMGLFEDAYIHTGGDEVPLDCWRTNPGIQQLVRKLDNSWKTRETGKPLTAKAWNYFVNRVTSMVKRIGEERGTKKRVIMWNEAFRNGLKIPNDSIIQVWFGNSKEVEKVIEKGHNVIYSECWYLDKVQSNLQWPQHYLCDPNSRTPGFEKREAKILGGEACLWSEHIASEVAMFYAWPRASVVAERLWSHRDVRDIDKAAARLQEHRCRMLRRGLQVNMINGPDYCPPFSNVTKSKVKLADKVPNTNNDAKVPPKYDEQKVKNPEDRQIKMIIDQLKEDIPMSVKENKKRKMRLKTQQETVFTIMLFLPFLMFTLLYCFLKIKRSKFLGRILYKLSITNLC
ncbi:beta-hexosaminidase subunit beta-like [Mizuhopecten yessoensis]|uniref:beta-N-acetylhexosaminidase n=1 Tax=Mizuhopecten yessoensis TaxID=6573 RepID=A0A210QUJ2_MIZYE|nr:beta-hexosaminidase subunit beta-like [Mizuhopecten yessoensis]OWF52376.1 Beta-hexosaminidase subunit beta [Mizuhopecten yessoensis]